MPKAYFTALKKAISLRFCQTRFDGIETSRGDTKMALYVIGDSHLSLSTEKPMDIFGSRWNGYVEKLKKHTQNASNFYILPKESKFLMQKIWIV